MANFEFIVGFIVNYFYFFVIKLNAMEVLVKLYGYFDHRYWRFWVSVASRLRKCFPFEIDLSGNMHLFGLAGFIGETTEPKG